MIKNLLAKASILAFIFFCEEMFLSGYSGPIIKLVDNEPVDMFHRNHGHLRHLFFDVASSGTQNFLHKSFQDLQITVGDAGRTSRALFFS